MLQDNYPAASLLTKVFLKFSHRRRRAGRLPRIGDPDFGVQ